MGTGALGEYFDVAQLAIYVFWIFFFGLIYWIRREDRREGYPAENDMTGRLEAQGLTMPTPKTFIVSETETYTVPHDERETAEFSGERAANFPGAPMVPVGDPMMSGMGPAAWCKRADHPEVLISGEPCVVPLRVATDPAPEDESRG